MTSLKYRFGIAVIAFLFLMVSPAAAQDYRGKVQGNVTDEACRNPGSQRRVAQYPDRRRGYAPDK